MRAFTDADLLAYLHGEMDAAGCEALEAAVETDPTLERRIMELDPIARDVHAAFEGLPSSERIDALAADLPEVREASTPWAMMVASAVVAAVIGFGAAQFMSGPDDDWRTQAAIYQALYVAETVEPIVVTDDGLAAQFARANAALGLDLDAGHLSAIPGLELKRAQILAHEGAPLIQVAFAAEDGTPFAFCVIRHDETGAAKVAQEKLAGLATAHWRDGAYGFMLIGGDDLAALDPMVAKLREIY